MLPFLSARMLWPLPFISLCKYKKIVFAYQGKYAEKKMFRTYEDDIFLFQSATIDFIISFNLTVEL